MKISDFGDTVVLFINEYNEIEHKIVFNGAPNIATLKENFDELSEFLPDICIDKLLVDIISMKKYIKNFGDEEIEE